MNTFQRERIRCRRRSSIVSFKLIVNYSGRAELATILDRTTRDEWPTAAKVMDDTEIRRWQQLAIGRC